MTLKLESLKWLVVISLQLVALFLNHVITLADARLVTSNLVTSNSVVPYKTVPMSQKELQRRLLKGREVMPPINSNALPGEPTCEELRAMWRYYRRQSRAELTNEIPRFGSNLFWDVLPSPQQSRMSSFAPMSRGRARARLKMKNPREPAYGRVVWKPERSRNRQHQTPRPMDTVSRLMGKEKSPKPQVTGPTQASIIHYSPPTTQIPTTPTSLQQIKEIFREERIRDKAPAMRAPALVNQEDGKTFGRMILGPPRGSDGRIANKPRELMTPFEKLRFGHADGVLDGSRANMNLMAKRRTFPIHAYRPAERQMIFRPPPPPQEIVDVGEGQEDLWTDVNNDDDLGSDLVVENPPGKLVLVDTEPFRQPQPVESLSCPQVEGQSCQINSDCSCVGFSLYRCHLNQCQVLALSPQSEAVPITYESEEDTSSMWHSEPIDTSKLGLWEDANTNTNLNVNA